MITTGVEQLGAGLLHAVHANPSTTTLVSNVPVGAFVSPYSCALALALVLQGAQPASTTARELITMLSGTSDNSITAEGVSKDVTALLNSIQSANNPANGLTIAVANSVWAKPSLPFKKEYVARVHSVLGASAEQLTSASVVNDWCAVQTRGKIKTIVDEQTVANMDAILVNALYFKGLWAHQFREASTQRGAFTLHTGEVVDVAMMSKKFERLQVEWALTQQYGAVRLPYKGGKFAAVAVVPAGDATLETLVHTHGLLSGTSIQWAGRDVFVFLPRFRLESEFQLRQPLAALGVSSMFEGSEDLNGVLDSPEPMQVDEVLQKVFIEVNEEGTEAAAVTAVMMRCCAAPMRTPEVRFDRPFLFSVVHTESNLVLFTGVVDRPEAWVGKDTKATTAGGPPPGYPTIA